MKIAILGSTHYKNVKIVRDYVYSLSRDSEIISTGNHGPAQIAVIKAMDLRMSFRVIYPNWELNGNDAKRIRDEQIVQCSDRVVCFWDLNTPNILNYVELARKHKKGILILDNDGNDVTDSIII